MSGRPERGPEQQGAHPRLAENPVYLSSLQELCKSEAFCSKKNCLACEEQPQATALLGLPPLAQGTANMAIPAPQAALDT